MGLHTAHVILQAIQRIVEANISALRNLVASHADVLKVDLVLRALLTYLPESTDPDVYTGFIRDLTSGALSPVDATDDSSSSILELSDSEARQQVRKLHLLQLTEYIDDDGNLIDRFTSFLLDRAHRIDSETGALPVLPQLLEPFLDHSQYLRTWAISKLLPLLRLNYEYYPDRAPEYSLQTFEALQVGEAVTSLLSEALRQNDEHPESELGRDLRCLVGPWMYGYPRKRIKLSTTERGDSQAPTTGNVLRQDLEGRSTSSAWSYVNDWLLELSMRNFSQAAKAFQQWDGPQDVDYGNWDNGTAVANKESDVDQTIYYMQTGLAIIYSTHSTSSNIFVESDRTIHRVADLLELRADRSLRIEDPKSSPVHISTDFVGSLSPAHLLHNALLRTSNPLTYPTNESIELANFTVFSGQILQSLGFLQPIKDILVTAVFGAASDQREILRKTLHALRQQYGKSKDDSGWKRYREQLLWLHDWGLSEPSRTFDTSKLSLGMFCKIDIEELEVEFLKMLLLEGHNNLAVSIYCTHSPVPLPMDLVEKATLEVAYGFYDNASNGNRSRGGMKKTSDLVAIFRPHFTESEAYRQINALLLATHALSYYTLVLHHGVPFQPVNIRSSPNALALIESVLKQNPRSYAKLDDLLDIGLNLVKAGLIKSDESTSSTQLDSTERQSAIVKRRIIAKAIEAALAEEDFDTAYSYVLNRLSPSEASRREISSTNEMQKTTEDNITWQAAFQAGRSPTKGTSGTSELRQLEQRMELLSQAVLLAPSPSLQEVLSTWRDCEHQMNQLLMQESEADSDWDSRGDLTLPGGFGQENIADIPQKPRESTRNALNEGAPMGLFDVARGAASAFSKTAFPLRSSGLTDSSLKGLVKTQVQPTSPAVSEAGGIDGEGRVRKRDMVSNMVTGGLASGIGWVLGAPSARDDH
ncbi:hypothetical protein MMC26_003530 [Xylographa opegraphella]|nr:hypothetical protein [Xylographa opegraphella]